MAIRKSFQQLHRHLWIVLYPVLFDTISLLAGWGLAGFTGQSRFSCKIVLEMGMPSLSQILNTPLLANQLEFLNRAPIPSYSWAIMALLLLASAYAQGGYISALRNIADEGTNSFRQFIRNGRTYWLQFICLYLIIMLAKVAVTAIMAMLLGSAGIFVSFLVFLGLRIAFIYLELSMVADHLSIGAAWRQSRNYWKPSIPQTAALIATMYLISGIMSILIQWFWLPVVVIAGIVVYGYAMAAVQLAFMINLCNSKA